MAFSNRGFDAYEQFVGDSVALRDYLVGVHEAHKRKILVEYLGPDPERGVHQGILLEGSKVIMSLQARSVPE
jgi:hypothetical protein